MTSKYLKFHHCVIFLTLLSFASSTWTNVEVIGGENSNNCIIQTSFKWGRVNRTTYVANGFFNITEDFSNAYEIEIKTYYSSKGNSHIRAILYGIPRTPLCNYIDGHYYRTVVHPDYQAHSNLPEQIPSDPLCPLYKKGNYTFTNWPMDGNQFLPKYLDAGYYMVYMLYYKRHSKAIICKRSYNFRLN